MKIAFDFTNALYDPSIAETQHIINGMNSTVSVFIYKYPCSCIHVLQLYVIIKPMY